MRIYEMTPVLDNPLFEGLSMLEHSELLDTWPTNWRANYQTWEPNSLKATWPTPKLVGNVRKFNDYPCINLTKPAFSQRAVDLLRNVLEPNGELLPVRHEIGTFYFYNCRTMTNCVDLTRSKTTRLKDGLVSSTQKLVFIDEMVDGLTVFKVRTQLIELFCSQTFVDRVESAGLRGFAFIPIWPLPDGVTFYDEMYRVNHESRKRRPKELSELDIMGNAVVVRLYCDRKKPCNKEITSAKKVVSHLENSLYDPDQNSSDHYFGNVEGYDVVDYEIRIFLSAPECDRLVSHLMPTLRTLPWPGQFHVVKRRGSYVDENAVEEYVRLDDGGFLRER